MKTIIIIPARYDSTRFPGKPLADICGKPMIWWVYHQCKKVKKADLVYVATDDERINKMCESLSIPVIMTDKGITTSTERAYQVAKKIDADVYVVVNGDEPLISPNEIDEIIPSERPSEGIYVRNLMTPIKNPTELIDFTNIKVVTDNKSRALFMSRGAIPFPKSSIEYTFYKHVGVLAYNYAALEFFINHEKGKNELIEDINELRYIENGVFPEMIPVEYETLSVDTPKDLFHVQEVIRHSRNINF